MQRDTARAVLIISWNDANVFIIISNKFPAAPSSYYGGVIITKLEYTAVSV